MASAQHLAPRGGPRRARARRWWSALATVAVACAAATGTAGAATPEPLQAPTPSDPRATFVEGNIVSCAAAGFGNSTQVGGQGDSSASDPNVSGTVAPNAGSVEPGQGEELNVAITGADVVIDAVIVKGGNGYNIYTDPAVLPPALGPPQHYISPFNGGGNIPAISHWFICYRVTTPPPTGSLSVAKLVIPPDGPPATPLPTQYTAIVDCDDGDPAHQNVLVTFSAAGGLSPTTLTGLAPGTTCTVVEQDTGTFPAGATITYLPAGADDPGVTIGADDAVLVRIINNFSGVQVQTAPVEVSKTVVGDVGDAPAEFTARLVCDDGTDSQITMPGTGGTGTPVPSVTVGSVCSLTELAGSIPPGWTVTYSVDGGAPTDTPPLFTVEDQTAVAVAIVNTAATTTTTTSTTTTTTSTTTPGTSTTAATSTTVSPTTIGPSTTAPPTIAPTSAAPPTTVGPQIPSTGAPTRSLVVFAAAALLAGAVLVVARRRITG